MGKSVERIRSKCADDTAFHCVFHEAKSIIQKACIDYPDKKLIVSFNGGKDATVVFYLVCAALAMALLKQKASTTEQEMQSVLKKRVGLLYFESQDAFSQVTTFVHAIAKAYVADCCCFLLERIKRHTRRDERML